MNRLALRRARSHGSPAYREAASVGTQAPPDGAVLEHAADADRPVTGARGPSTAAVVGIKQVGRAFTGPHSSRKNVVKSGAEPGVDNEYGKDAGRPYRYHDPVGRRGKAATRRVSRTSPVTDASLQHLRPENGARACTAAGAGSATSATIRTAPPPRVPRDGGARCACSATPRVAARNIDKSEQAVPGVSSCTARKSNRSTRRGHVAHRQPAAARQGRRSVAHVDGVRGAARRALATPTPGGVHLKVGMEVPGFRKVSTGGRHARQIKGQPATLGVLRHGAAFDPALETPSSPCSTRTGFWSSR
jgi:hypothetical protein